MMLSPSFDSTKFRYVYDHLAAPAAGVDIVFPGPLNTFIQPVTFRCVLVSDATIIARHVYMRLYSGAIIFGQVESAQAQTAGLTMSYVFGISGANSFTGGGTLAVYIPMLDQIHMDHTNSLLISANNLQAGDQFTFAEISYKQWTVQQ